MSSVAEQDPTPRAELVLGPLLRYADETSATVWVEVSGPATVSVLASTATTFQVAGRHYALVPIEGLEPGGDTEYSVAIDGETVWPEPDSNLPPSVIRTPGQGDPVSILIGSCRAAAPHEPPYTLELALDNDGRGIDTLWAHGQRMLIEDNDKWPHLLLMVGDQIYADDSSPAAKQRIEQRRSESVDLPPEVVLSFKEYCWLYQEAWSQPIERWLLSTVPSAMIFDDHDNIDDWNISFAWVRDVEKEPWWAEHSVAGLMSYWIYQHLGNLSTAAIRDEGLLTRLESVPDGTDILREWAADIASSAVQPGGYQFSFVRSVGDVTVVVMDCRNGRVLREDTRLMIGHEEWSSLCQVAEATTGHLVLATSVPVFIPDGLHDLQVWNERVAEGAWGSFAASLAEKVRRGLDLEDWSAFGQSYQMFVDLLGRLQTSPSPPRSVVIASGDIHFSYAAHVPSATEGHGPEVWQVVSSPIRNALIPPERGVMRSTLTPLGRAFGNLLRVLSRAPETRPGIELAVGPFFANNMAELHYVDGQVNLQIEQSFPDEDGNPQLSVVADLPLGTP